MTDDLTLNIGDEEIELASIEFDSDIDLTAADGVQERLNPKDVEYSGSFEFTHEFGDDKTLIEGVFGEVVAAEMKRREKELYAAWRAEYDFLYVVVDYDWGSRLPKYGYFPSNNPEHRFRWLDQTERYDLRYESLSPKGRELLEEYSP